MTKKQQFTNIDQYISTFPAAVQTMLQELRETISAAAPQAEETINYQMPTFKLNGNLVHFAAYKKHIGFYPAPSGINAFRAELEPYELSKGTIKFPLDQPLPLELIGHIVKFRVQEQMKK